MHRKKLINKGASQFDFPRVSRREHRIIMRAAREGPFTNALKSHLYAALKSRVPRSDALLAVLIGSLPGLERLEVAIEDPVNPELYLPEEQANLFERALWTSTGVSTLSTNKGFDGRSALLPKLSHFKAEVAGNSPSGEVAMLAQILQMRRVTHFYGARWSHSGVATALLLQGDFRDLVHLELRDCNLNRDAIGRLFGRTSSLRTLIYQRGWKANLTHYLSIWALRSALHHLARTLNCLELSFNRTGRNSPESLYIQPINLSFLFRVKRLRISAGYLVTSERKKTKISVYRRFFWDHEGSLNATRPVRQLLPPSLEKLEIIQVEDIDELNTLCDKLVSSLLDRASIVSDSIQGDRLDCLEEIILEHPFEDQYPRVVDLDEAAWVADVKLTTLHNCVDSATTRNSKSVRADKQIDWGFDREVKWKHPFSWRDEVKVRAQ
jgi:hypothetical protein